MKIQKKQQKIIKLSSKWIKLAELCELELLKANDAKETLIMSSQEKAKYEQAAITYRFCANTLYDKIKK